ncbi:MAG TPA: hypothetical protein EYO31_00650, partial [Phycisphaerales bacterium]|nr:hypothetical protein [Phycisphaerales bacterium]
MKRLCLLLISVVAGCDRGFQDIDKRVDAVMSTASGNMDAIHPSPTIFSTNRSDSVLTNPNPATLNPSAEELGFTPATPLDEDEIS